MSMLKHTLASLLLGTLLTSSPALAGNAATDTSASAASASASVAGTSVASTSTPQASQTMSSHAPPVSAQAGSAPVSGVGNLLQVISALILVVVIMLALAWALKNFGPKRLLGRVPVQVVGGVNLGGRERVLVIEVADQWIVIGATPNQITTLATLPAQSMANDEIQPGKPFSEWLKQIMEKKHG